MKAFWRKEPSRREYRSVSLVAASWQSADSCNNEENDEIIELNDITRDQDVTKPLISPSQSRSSSESDFGMNYFS